MGIFNSNTSRDVAKLGSGSSVPPGQVNMIGQGTIIDGTIQARGDFRIGGRVIGKVMVEGKVVITPEGGIEGDLTAANADIAGHVRGEIFIRERLVLKGPATIDGNIRTSKLVIEDGAVFTGKCDMSGEDAAPTPAEGETGHSAFPTKPDLPV